jgi:transposase
VPRWCCPPCRKDKQLLADKGYDADWFRAALAKRRITPCIPSKANRKTAIPHDALLYKQRHKIENMFGRPQRLAAHPHPIRPLRPYLLLGSASPQPSYSGCDQ